MVYNESLRLIDWFNPTSEKLSHGDNFRVGPKSDRTPRDKTVDVCTVSDWSTKTSSVLYFFSVGIVMCFFICFSVFHGKTSLRPSNFTSPYFSYDSLHFPDTSLLITIQRNDWWRCGQIGKTLPIPSNHSTPDFTWFPVTFRFCPMLIQFSKFFVVFFLSNIARL